MEKISRNSINMMVAMATMLICCLMVSCQKDDNPEIQPNKNLPQSLNGRIVLGDKIPDPYSMTYMVPAFDSLKMAGLIFPFDNIAPTGYYVKVIADNDSIKELITSDTSVVWFNYPLDYEVSEDGYYFEDKYCSTSCDYIYAVVPVVYEYRAPCEKEILDSVFIPGDYPAYDKNEYVLDALEDAAYKAIGEEPHAPKANNKVYRKATLTVQDDKSDEQVPLQGVRVVFKQHSKSSWGVTNAQGVAISGKKFKAKYGIRYSLEWHRDYWQIWQQQTIQSKKNKAEYTGPFLYSDWAFNITSSKPELLMHASVHRALLLTYYSSLWSIEKPGRRWGGKLNAVCVNSASSLPDIAATSNFDNNPRKTDFYVWIRICGNSYNQSTDELMAVTLHELAHWSTYKHSNYTRPPANVITESWAQCVSWDIMTRYYQLSNMGYSNARQDWMPTSPQGEYSPLFIDLIDDYNQRRNGNMYPDDVISGYTIQYIQNNVINNCFSYDRVRNNMLSNRISGVTEADIRRLLGKYDEAFLNN